jgi:hypothetical protein
MIQANELRVGNYVTSDHFKDRDVIVKVRLIGQEQAIVEHPNGLTEPMLYQVEMRAVTLTNDIIWSCGGEQYDSHENYIYIESDNNVELHIFNWKTPVGVANNVPTGAYYVMMNNTMVILKYLHQLQNLYFALSGKELEIKF